MVFLGLGGLGTGVQRGTVFDMTIGVVLLALGYLCFRAAWRARERDTSAYPHTDKLWH